MRILDAYIARYVVGGTLLALAVLVPFDAQAQTATLEGQVTDAQGGAVAGAAVTTAAPGRAKPWAMPTSRPINATAIAVDGMTTGTSGTEQVFPAVIRSSDLDIVDPDDLVVDPVEHDDHDQEY